MSLKEKIKAVMFDLDGTLIDYNYQMSDRVKNTLIEMKKTGLPLAMNSGRPVWISKKVIDELVCENFFDYSFGCNGSEYLDPVSKDIKLLSSVKLSEIYELNKMFDHPKLMLCAYDNDHLLMNRNTGADFIESWLAKRYVKAKVVDFDPVNRQNENIIAKDYPKLLCLFDKDDRSILDEVVAGIKDDRFNFMVSGPYCMEIVPKGVSKAVACDKFAEILNINNDEILSFGDSDNDMGMLLNSCGVILGHAPERLKCQLQYITDGVEADGVYTFLKKEGFIA